MGVQVPIGFGQATMRWQLAGDPEVQVVTFGVSPIAPLEADGIATQINIAGIDANLTSGAGMQTGWTFLGTWVDWRTDTGFIRYEANTVTPGTNVGTGLPSNCALLVTKRTILGGRRFKGRNFFPACYLYETSVDQRGALDGAVLAALQVRFDQFRDELFAQGVQPLLLHSGPTVPTPITRWTVAPTIATQRRRMR